MKSLQRISLFLIAALIMGACSTSNNVVSNRMIQKRKYNKGFHLNNKQAFKSSKEQLKKEEYTAQEKSKKVLSSGAHVKVPTKRAELVLDRISTLKKVLVKSSLDKKNSESKNVSSKSVAALVVDNEKKKSDKPKIGQKERPSRESQRNPATDGMTILLVILAIIIPPLAVFLYEGASKRFWIDLILALLGWGVLGWLLPHLFWLGGLIAIIYALLIVLGVI